MDEQRDRGANAAAYREMAAPFLPVLLVPVAWLLSNYAAGHPAWAERYVGFFTQYITRPISLALGVFPFSIAEILLILGILSFLGGMLGFLLRRDWLNAVACPLAAAAMFYALFAAGWGVAYSRLPYADTAGLAVEAVSADELEALTLSLAERANALREGAREDGDGVYMASGSGEELLGRVQAAYDAASARYPWLAGRFGNPKPILLSEALSHLQISGIFIPYTLEANVNMNTPIFMIPATACHEAAHMRGWAREDEANYIAYAVCAASGDADFAYSGLLLGLIHASNALASADADRYWAVREQFSEGVERDIAANTAHWRQYEGKASEIHEQVNDSYLKANRQEDGVKSYGRMVDLMVAEMKEWPDGVTP